MATIFNWLRTSPDFLAQYERAKEEAADAMIEETLDIADDGTNDWMDQQRGDQLVRVIDHEHVSRSKLRVDTRKWIASKLKPKRYGDRTSMELTGKDGGAINVNVMDTVAERVRAAKVRNAEEDSEDKEN